MLCLYLYLSFQEYSLNISPMTHNYHKRLVTNYLSQPKYGLHRSGSEHSYFAAANAKTYNNAGLNNSRGTPIYYNLGNASNFCEQCSLEQRVKRLECTHDKLNKGSNSKYNNRNNGIGVGSSQYYSPQIKTIKNTLLDIRDQMKTKRRGKAYAYSIKQNYRDQHGIQNNWQVNRNDASRFQQLQRRNNELVLKIEQLTQIIGEFERKNSNMREDLEKLQARLKNCDLQLQQRRQKINKAESERYRAQQRQRSLQIKIMDMRAELMAKQQILRQLNLNQSQLRQKQLTKRIMMGASEEVSMVVWGKDGYKQTRGMQTNLSEIDIENGFKQLNQMQDQLCDKINGNLKVERKIFARIAQIDEKLNFAMNKLYYVQQQASRLGIGANMANY